MHARGSLVAKMLGKILGYWENILARTTEISRLHRWQAGCVEKFDLNLIILRVPQICGWAVVGGWLYLHSCMAATHTLTHF
jgi:hypothetical protein